MIEQGETLLIGRDKTAREDAEGARITGELYYGLTNQLTLASSGAYLDVPGEGKKLITKFGLRGSYFSASERFDVLSDHSGGHGLHFGLQRKFFNTDVQVSHVEFFDMATEREQDLSRLFTLRMDKYFGNFSLGFKAERETSADGINYHEIGVRASGSIAGINLTHRVEANLNEGQDTVRANLLASGRATSDLHLRGGIEYAVQPIVELEKFTASLDYQQNEKIRYRIAGSKSVKYDRELFLSSGIFWDTGKASLGLTGSYSSEHDLQVIASITFSLSPDSSGSYELNSKPSSNIGRIDVRVFLDRNNDGIFNKDDQPLEGVRLVRGGKEKTNNNGVATVSRPAYHLASFGVDERSLEDPFWVGGSAVHIRPMPGNSNWVDVPVWETGEIEAFSIPGEQVKIYQNGKEKAQKFSDYDGFVVFEKVRYGTYVVQSGDRFAEVHVNQENPVSSVQWK